MDAEIYLDNNATTRPLPEVREAMLAALDEGYGNPSSEHARGQRARDALHRARCSVAALVGADPSQLSFTSGATEANNLAIHSAVRLASKGATGRIVTTTVEHSSILKVCEHYAARGVEVVSVPVDSQGALQYGVLEAILTSNDLLVSVQWANNETGVVQPIGEIGRLCRRRGVPLHVDAAQAIGKLEIDLAAANADYVSLTAHKMHGPLGIGALYVREPKKLAPMFFGGPQESGLRPGTENLPAIVGFGVAAELRRSRFAEVRRQLRELRDAFESRLAELLPDVSVNGQYSERLANSTNPHFAGVDGQALVARLDQSGVRCSQSSACTSRHPAPSYVLRAMGLSAEEAYSSVRFSFGEFNRFEEVAAAATQIADVCHQLRRFSARQIPARYPAEVG